jgi:predicted RNase H-like HicB family nuclease
MVDVTYRVALQRTEEGYSVSVPGLPGCWSQGVTEAEALENFEDALRDYLAVNAFTMGGIAGDAGLSPDAFKKLL